MQVPQIFLRITKLLSKVILGLLLLVLVAVVIIHLPPVQKRITHELSDYLSSKVQAKVAIQRIEFSLSGDVAIEDIRIWDPHDHQIFSAQQIDVSASIFNLIAGDLIFNDVHIAGVEGKLVQSHEGLNIQYIIDAFSPAERQTVDSAGSVVLQFENVLLEDIAFEYTSDVSGVSVVVNLGELTCRDGQFSTLPTKIRADQIMLQHTKVNTLTMERGAADQDDQSAGNKYLSPDFGTGIAFDIRSLEFNDNTFSFHQDHVVIPSKFDPAHLTLKHIQLSLADILIREDTLAASLQTCSVQLPEFTLTDARSKINLNRNQLFLSSIYLASGPNEIKAEFTAPLTIISDKGENELPVEIVLQSRMNPQTLAYFFSDSTMRYFSQWQNTEVALEGNYLRNTGTIKKLQIKTANSQLQAAGVVQHVLDKDKLAWKDLEVNAIVGADFTGIVKPVLKNLDVPDQVSLQLKSAGNLQKIYSDIKILTNWGNAKFIGFTLLHPHHAELDLSLTTENFDLGKWINQSWLGAADISAVAKGFVGDRQNLQINGLIDNLEMLNQSIQHIDFQSRVITDSAEVQVSIDDNRYRSDIHSEISFAGPLVFTNSIQLDSFRLGELLRLDSTLLLSGYSASKIVMGDSFVDGLVEGSHIVVQKKSMKHVYDTLFFHANISKSSSEIQYFTEDAHADLKANFDVREFSTVMQSLSGNVLKSSDDNTLAGSRTAQLHVNLQNPNLIQMLGVEVDDFSSLTLTGEFDEQKKTVSVNSTSGRFKGHGISFDTLHTNLTILRDTISAALSMKDLFYESNSLGDLSVNVITKGDTAISTLRLATDTLTLVGLSAGILKADSGSLVYPYNLVVLDHEYSIETESPVFIGNNNLVFDHFQINRGNMRLDLNGDLNYFDIALRNINLTPLNLLLPADTTIINKGYLNGNVSYSRERQLNLDAHVDSLSLYKSSPLTITAGAVSDGNQVPFTFQLANTTNTIDLKGQYSLDNKEVEAALMLDVNDIKLFDFLASEFISEMSGGMKGKATVSGPIQTPIINGIINFSNMELTTVNPKLTFNVPDDQIVIDNSSLLFDSFTFYDQKQHPLTLHGYITSNNYQSLSYDLQIKADDYTLINHPDSTSGKIRGQLVLASDIKMKGSNKGTFIDAKIGINDKTDLTFVASNDEVVFLNTEGIVEFVDPAVARDSAALESTNFYDSLIASLPEFNLNSTITIDEDAKLRLIIDEQSGDYIRASGSANLELGYDRTGNLQLSGNYTVKNGVYRLSFYDLVKKNFNLLQGSSINWNGSPENGDLSIKAMHIVESNSIGLIGHEIGENEKSIYKRSLDYQVGINIGGTIERPVISFSLDLPKEEKVSYPVLANKLDRLRQPEYESELNKQVFGLLVLGGFLPESSGSDINSSLIATTALSNSVNSLLASQLNRFASQYVKGVNIDVGIQSFSDYSAPGGKTQTAMDFRVSKSMMNDRLSFEIGGDFDINQDQSGANTGNKNYRGDIAIIYDLTGHGDKQLKLFNNETYDIIYQEIRNTGISLIFIREFSSKEKKNKKKD